MKALVVVAVLFAAAVAGQAQARQDPATFLADIVRLQISNRYAEAWTTLNPVHQAVAPRDVYIACETSRPITVPLVSLRVVRQYDDPIALIPGRRRVPAVAVTFALDAGDVHLVMTRHAVAFRGRWTWILSPRRYAEYTHHVCGNPAL